MGILITFVPLLCGLLVPAGIIICVWLIVRKSSNNKDQMLQQLILKNKELEEKINQPLEQSNSGKND